MKRNVKRPVTPVTLSLFKEQVEELRRMPNASMFIREQLDKVLSKPLSDVQISALKTLYEQYPKNSPYALMQLATDNGISVSTMQCNDFLIALRSGKYE
jgi:hypothetical protein